MSRPIGLVIIFTTSIILQSCHSWNIGICQTTPSLILTGWTISDKSFCFQTKILIFFPELLLINHPVWDSWVWVTIIWRSLRRSCLNLWLSSTHSLSTTTTWRTSMKCSLVLATWSISASPTTASSGLTSPSSLNPFRRLISLKIWLRQDSRCIYQGKYLDDKVSCVNDIFLGDISCRTKSYNLSSYYIWSLENCRKLEIISKCWMISRCKLWISAIIEFPASRQEFSW